MNLNEFAKEVHALAVEKGFYTPQPSDSELIAAIHSEISEAFEEWRANRPMVYYMCRLDTICNGDCQREADTCVYRNPEPHGIAVELIDVALRILDAAAAWDVTLHDCEPLGIEYIDWNAYSKRKIKDLSLPELITGLHQTIVDIDFDRANDNDLGDADSMCYPISLLFAWLRAQGIKPEPLLMEKHKYNQTRSYRHGGKRV